MKRKSPDYFENKSKISIAKLLIYLFSTIVVLLLVLVLITLFMTRNASKPQSVFGHRLFIITTNSMQDKIPVGSAIIVKEQGADTYQTDDIITFKEGEDDKGNLIINTHRIVSSTPTAKGLIFVTKGDNNKVADTKPRKPEDIYGKVIVIMPTFGKFLTFIKSPTGLIICIAFPLILLLILEIRNLLKLKKEPSDEEKMKNDNKNRADLFGTNSNKQPKTLEKKEPVKSLPKPISREENAGNSNNQTKEIDTNFYGFNENKNFDEYPPEEQPVHTHSTEKIEVKEQQKIREEKIVTKQEEDFEILNNMDGFAFVRPKNDNTETDYTKVDIINQFSNGNNDFAVMTSKANPEFSAQVKANGKDSFVIDGIDVKVQSDSINLGLDENNNGREISITVTSEYTNVVVCGKEFEVNFALFKDDKDNKQKVVIERKDKKL